MKGVKYVVCLAGQGKYTDVQDASQVSFTQADCDPRIGCWRFMYLSEQQEIREKAKGK